MLLADACSRTESSTTTGAGGDADSSYSSSMSNEMKSSPNASWFFLDVDAPGLGVLVMSTTK